MREEECKERREREKERVINIESGERESASSMFTIC